MESAIRSYHTKAVFNCIVQRRTCPWVEFLPALCSLDDKSNFALWIARRPLLLYSSSASAIKANSTGGGGGGGGVEIPVSSRNASFIAFHPLSVVVAAIQPNDDMVHGTSPTWRTLNLLLSREEEGRRESNWAEDSFCANNIPILFRIYSLWVYVLFVLLRSSSSLWWNHSFRILILCSDSILLWPYLCSWGLTTTPTRRSF